MGSTLAALGLLSQCRWDTDETYHPIRIGTYLWADSILYFLPADGGNLFPLQRARALAADGETIAALSLDGNTLTYYEPASTSPARSLSLPASCCAIAPAPEKAGFLLGAPNGLWEVSPTYRLKALDTTPAFQLISHMSFVLAQSSALAIRALSPKPPYLPLASLSLPGPLRAWWVESPTMATGIFHYGDTLYSFTYQSPARLFVIDTLRPALSLQKATSPYLTARWGTEYTGSFILSPQGELIPPGTGGVQTFTVDFFGGYLYYVRADTLWERNLHTNTETFRAAPFRTMQLKVVGVYSQGRAMITTR